MESVSAKLRALQRVVNMPSRAVAAALLRRHPDPISHRDLFHVAKEVDAELVGSKRHFKSVLRFMKDQVRYFAMCRGILRRSLLQTRNSLSL
mmetsp:Transcript_16283/g.33046  ORF Transcript_16283/g.33046 Transcript_16283/m.33046 type:complete len:92 (-) Transcript_16283:1110-1385(-)